MKYFTASYAHEKFRTFSKRVIFKHSRAFYDRRKRATVKFFNLHTRVYVQKFYTPVKALCIVPLWHTQVKYIDTHGKHPSKYFSIRKYKDDPIELCSLSSEKIRILTCPLCARPISNRIATNRSRICNILCMCVLLINC